MAYIGRQLVRGQNRVLDDISGSFNGSTTAFNLTVSSSSSPPASVNQLWIILGGVLQKPGTDFTVADAVITFTTAPAATLSFWGMIQGDTSDINAPSDASVTPSKIANSGDFAFPADVRFKDADGSHYVGLQAPSTISSNLVWTLPAADGSANQVLKTDGSGALGWATDSALTLVDEDNMSSNSASSVPSQQSVKAYVDTGDATKMPLAGGTFTGDITIPDKIIHDGDTNTALRFPAADTVSVETGGNEALRVDSSGRLIVGHTSSINSYGENSQLQVSGTGYADSTIAIRRDSADTGSGSLILSKSRGSAGGVTVVQDGDKLGSIVWCGADGTDANSSAGGIQCVVDGTPGANDMPGRLEFYTTNDGSGGITEKMRIDSSGNVGINETSPQQQLHVHDDTSYHGVLINGNGAPRLAFARNTTTTGEWSAGVDGTDGTQFVINNSNDNSNRKIIVSSTLTTLNQNTQVNGNFIFGSAGNGVDFSAQTQSTSTTDDEVLDHYEKGKWTPVIKKNGGDNAHASNGGTPTVIHGRYIRVGKLCWLSMYVRWNSGSNSEGTSGGWQIEGLPFALQDDDPGTCRIYQSAPAGYWMIDGVDYFGTTTRWQVNYSDKLDLYTGVSSADLAWTTGMMIVAFTGAFQIHE